LLDPDKLSVINSLIFCWAWVKPQTHAQSSILRVWVFLSTKRVIGFDWDREMQFHVCWDKLKLDRRIDTTLINTRFTPVPGQFLGSYVISWVFTMTTRLVQWWLSWVFATHERKKERYFFFRIYQSSTVLTLIVTVIKVKFVTYKVHSNASGARLGSGNPRLCKGGQGEEGWRRFSIVGVRSRTLGTIPQYRFNKTKQHTHWKSGTVTIPQYLFNKKIIFGIPTVSYQ